MASRSREFSVVLAARNPDKTNAMDKQKRGQTKMTLILESLVDIKQNPSGER